MAKVNMVIRAFDPEEIQMLKDIVVEHEKRSLEEGYILPQPFNDLKDSIELASKYASGAGNKRAG